MIDNAAHNLLNITLSSGWEVIQKIEIIEKKEKKDLDNWEDIN